MAARKKRGPGKRVQRVDQWCAQADWLLKYIEQLPKLPTAHGLKWTTKMIAHYCCRYDELAKNTPPSCRGSERNYRERIDRVRAWGVRRADK